MRAAACALFLALGACEEAEAPKQMPAVDPQAPSLRRASASTDSEVLVLEVAQDGTVIIDGRWLLEDDTILARVRTFHVAHPGGRAELRCDPSTLHGRGVRVLEILQQGEVSKISML